MTYGDNYEDLKGKTLSEVNVMDDEIIFTTTDDEQYKMWHQQDCCEHVYIEDFCGDKEDLIGSPLLQVEEVSSEGEGPIGEYEESYTWTFYKMATIKGSVTIRWYGSSNGYYSESVSFQKLDY